MSCLLSGLSNGQREGWSSDFVVATLTVAAGAGMINFFRQLGGAFGVNLLSVSLDRDTFFYSDRLTSMETAGNSSTRELLRAMEQLLAQAGVPPDLQAAREEIPGQLINRAA